MIGLSYASLSGLLMLASSAVATPLVEPVSSVGSSDSFDPTAYKKTFVNCPAVERGRGAPRSISLRLGYIDVNPSAEKTLILAHGWPSLWTTYRHQITEFGKDYRLIIPEHRGFGDSEHPVNLNASNTMQDFTNDMICMMNNAKVNSGVCVGNDFGAQLCWEAGRARPDKFIGVFNVGIPYVSSAEPFVPNEVLATLNPSFGYQVYLSGRPRAAALELNGDVRSTIRSCAQVANSTVPADFLKPNNTFLGPWRTFEMQNNLTEIPFSGIMSQKVEDYMVASYKKQGLYNTFNGYQYGNRKLTYDFNVAQGNFTLDQPTFTLFPTKDPVADWQAFAAQINASSFLTNQRNTTIETAHWPQEEKPDQFNSILREWLETSVTFPA